MKRVRAQGCHTLYKSQVILSTKDTPLVPKLCIKSQHDGVLHRPPIILLAATHLLEPLSGIKGARRGVRVAHLEVHLPHAARCQQLENVFHERASQPGTPASGGHGKVQDLAFVRGIERHYVPQDRAPAPISLRDEELCERDAVREILRGPRIAEDLVLDRVNGRDVAEHGGDIGGFAGLLVVVPEERLGFFIMHHGEGSSLRFKLRQMLLDQLAPGQAAAPVALAGVDLAPYAGTYRASFNCHSCADRPPVPEFAVTVEGGALGLWGDRWLPIARDLFAREDGRAKLAFVRDGAGRVVALSGGSWRVGERIADAPTPETGEPTKE